MSSARIRGRLLSVATVAAISAYGASAFAITFPTTWQPLTQSAVPMGDVTSDGISERDVVGDASNPAAYVQMDATHLFFRLRVNSNPKFADKTFRPFGWACTVDSDPDPKTIEFMAVVNGIESSGPDGNPDQVEWRFNSTKTSDAINDSVETLVSAYPATEPTGNARVTIAPTMFSGDADYFIDWAIPLSVIRMPPAASGAPAIAESTPLRFACGTSVGASRIDADPLGAGSTYSSILSDPLFCGPTGCILDRDGDGVQDSIEISLGTNPLNPDSDGDGILDGIELSASGGLGPFVGIDTDADGTIDALDLDSDGDSHADSVETILDSDGDGKGNWRDLDSDNDCLLDRFETVAGLRDPAVPGASSANCGSGLVCDVTTGTCVSPGDAGLADGGVGDTAVGDGSTGDGSTGDGSSGDGTVVTDGSSGDGGGDGTVVTDGSGGDGTVVTDGSGDGTITDGDASTADSGADTSATDDTGVGATDNDILDTGTNPATPDDSVLEGGGCACTTTGACDSSSTSLGVIALAGLVLAAGRRRKR